MLAALVLLGALSSVQAQGFDITSIFARREPTLQPTEYDGFELRYWRFVFRPALFKTEALVLLAITLYLTTYFIGKNTNASRAKAWMTAHSSLYAAQFSNPIDGGEVVADGPTDLSVYSSGRRGVRSLHTTFALLPRHDIFLQIFLFVRNMIWLDWVTKDEISLDFTLDTRVTSVPGFVWGVVTKDELRQLRADRWDLNLFTKTTDSIPVDPSVQVMAENTDVNNVLLKSGATPSLLAALKNPEALKYFRALVISDQPYERPDTYELKDPLPSLLSRPRHLILTLSLPPASEASSTLPLVQAAFELVDALLSINSASTEQSSISTSGVISSLPAAHSARQAVLQPDTIRKLRATRKEWDERLEKERVAEKLAEEEEAKRAAKKKAEDERVSKLSASEQTKILEKERKRSLRKAQMKSSRK